MASFDPEGKVVVYGRAATGKTTFAGSFPKPILYLDCSEKGTDSVRDLKDVFVIRVKKFQQIIDIYWAAMKGKLVHPKTGKRFQTIAWDTLSQAQLLVIRELKEARGDEISAGSEAQWGSMTKKDWGEVATKMKEWITNYRDLEDTNVVFIAHDRVFKGDDDDDNSEFAIDPVVGPALSPSVATHLNASVNVILNTFIRERTVEVKLGKGKVKKKRKIEYCMRVGPHGYYVTKVRKPKSVEIPDVLVDPCYEDIMEFIEGEK